MDIDTLEAGRGLDELVHERVLGLCPHPLDQRKRWYIEDGNDYDSGSTCLRCKQEASLIPTYSYNIVAVGALLIYMKDHGSSLLLNWGEDTGQWECSWITGGQRFTGYGATLELAACRAALKASFAKETTIE